MKNRVHFRKNCSKSNKINCKDKLVNSFRDFSSTTSLHGVKNIVEAFDYLEKSRTKLSKRYSYLVFDRRLSSNNLDFYRKFVISKVVHVIIWGGSFLAGIILLLILLNLIWQRSGKTPTITTIDTYYHPIWDVPFPAVTLCNINKVHRSSLQAIIKQL